MSQVLAASKIATMVGSSSLLCARADAGVEMNSAATVAAKPTMRIVFMVVLGWGKWARLLSVRQSQEFVSRSRVVAERASVCVGLCACVLFFVVALFFAV